MRAPRLVVLPSKPLKDVEFEIDLNFKIRKLYTNRKKVYKQQKIN